MLAWTSFYNCRVAVQTAAATEPRPSHSRQTSKLVAFFELFNPVCSYFHFFVLRLWFLNQFSPIQIFSDLMSLFRPISELCGFARIFDINEKPHSTITWLSWILSGRQIGRLLFGICTLLKVIIAEDWPDALHDCPDGNSGTGRPIFSRILSPTAFRPPTRKSAARAASRAEKHARETACERGADWATENSGEQADIRPDPASATNNASTYLWWKEVTNLQIFSFFQLLVYNHHHQC